LSDSDSSQFHWLYEHLNRTDKVNPEWPQNYVERIKKFATDTSEDAPEYIFVSTHEDIMNAVLELNLPSFTVVPAKEDKAYYLNLYKERGSSESFVKLMDEKWDEFIDGATKRATDEKHKNSTLIILHQDRKIKTIYDIVKRRIKPAMIFDAFESAT
jgi:vacuolar-type H+-ATPase subunit E/Vma4